MELTFVRHTKVVVPSDFCYGQTELELVEPLFPPFERLLPYLPVCPERIYTSPLLRARKLAEKYLEWTLSGMCSGEKVLHDGQKISPFLLIDPRLMEVSLGEWEGKTWSEIKKTPEYDSWDRDTGERPPGGESFLDLFERAGDFFRSVEEESLEKNSFERAVVFTHGGILRSVVACVLGLPIEESFKLRLDYGAILRITAKFDEEEKKKRYWLDFLVNPAVAIQ